MKSLTIFLFVVAFSQGEFWDDERALKLKRYKMECLSRSKVNVEEVDELKMGVFAESKGLKEFLFCLAQRTGFLDKDGVFHEDRIRAVIEANHGTGAAETIITSCLNYGDSPPETSFQLAQCMFETSKGYISLSPF